MGMFWIGVGFTLSIEIIVGFIGWKTIKKYMDNYNM